MMVQKISLVKMKYIRRMSCVCILMLLMQLFVCFDVYAEESDIITDFNELKAAIVEAEAGDVILVGNIDFTPTSPTVVNSYMCIEIDKSITIKSGMADAAVFTNGGFILSGSKISGEKTVCYFENIIFDGKADYANLTAKDYEYPWSEAEQVYTMNVPLKAQQALAFRGNVDADFQNCVFKNYMHEYGPVIDIRYGDYTDNAYLLDMFGDNSGCKINLNFKECSIENNSAFYDGGAIYIESNKNVSLTADKCIFSGNKSGAGEFRRGGGAIYASNAILNLTDCKIEQNIGNYVYEGTKLSEYDTKHGGALMLESSVLNIVNSSFMDNQASMGGAISMTNTKADLDGVLFENNRAAAYALNPDNMTGPWNNMAQGGAIYVEGSNGTTVSLINCDIRNNSAQTAYGGICAYYTPNEDFSLGTYYVKMNLCSYEGNKVDSVYDYTVEPIYPWASHPGDLFVNPHLTMFGCYVVDETCEKDFPHKDIPNSENGYNYISSVSDKEIQNFSIPLDEAEKLIDRYGDRIKELHVGSNYSESLYIKDSGNQETESDTENNTESHTSGTTENNTEESTKEPDNTTQKPNNYWWLLGVGAVILVAAGVVVVIMHKKMASKPQTAEITPEETQAVEKKQIVRLRYSEEDIDKFISLVPETGLLTARELEVFREILRGKKQGEVAYYLGIEVSTVKDFYKKVYVKLDVGNKDGLLKKVSETLDKN